MNCPNCGKVIPQDNAAWCPFCGAKIAATRPSPQQSPAMAQPASDPQAVLTGAFRTINQRFGPEAMKDGGFIMANITQMGPNTARFAPLVDAFLRCGGNTELVAVQDAKPKMQAAAFAQTVSRMTAMQVHEADARFICDCFSAAIAPPPSTPEVESEKRISNREKKPQKKTGKKLICGVIVLLVVAALIACGIYFAPRLFSSDESEAQTVAEDSRKEKGEGSESENSNDHIDTNSPNADEFDSSAETILETEEAQGNVPDKDESTAQLPDAPTAEDSVAAQEGDVNTPVPEISPAAPATEGIVIGNEYYQVTLPSAWDGLYCDEHRNGTDIGFYEISAYEELGAGHLFTITLQNSDYTYHPAFRILGKFTAQNGSIYDVVVFFPTDVQALEGHYEIYAELSAQTDTILATFTPQPGCSFEAKSTTSVLNTYINTMPYLEKEGKLWLHEDTPHTGGNSTVNDYSAPGYIERPVRDNQGNTYTYGLHLDGYGANTFYITYDLCGVYSTFSGTCILPDTMVGTGDTKYFQIYCDDVLVFTSETMEDGCQPQDFTIDVTGVHYLIIVYPPTAGSNETAVLADGLLQ